MKCEDCGTTMEGRMCPNRHEELYILTYQAEYVDTVSPEFAALAEEQQQAIKRKSEPTL